MKGKMHLSFTARNSTDPERLYDAVFPVDIVSSDGVIDDKITLNAETFNGMSVDFRDGGACDGNFKGSCKVPRITLKTMKKLLRKLANALFCLIGGLIIFATFRHILLILVKIMKLEINHHIFLEGRRDSWK